MGEGEVRQTVRVCACMHAWLHVPARRRLLLHSLRQGPKLLQRGSTIAIVLEHLLKWLLPVVRFCCSVDQVSHVLSMTLPA